MVKLPPGDGSGVTVPRRFSGVLRAESTGSDPFNSCFARVYGIRLLRLRKPKSGIISEIMTIFQRFIFEIMDNFHYFTSGIMAYDREKTF